MLQEKGATECNWVKDGHTGCKCQTCCNMVQEVTILLLHLVLRSLLYLQLVIFDLYLAAAHLATGDSIVHHYFDECSDIRFNCIQKEVGQ